MTKQLREPNVQVAVKRTGMPRLTSAERKQLASVQDPVLKQIMGEIFIASRANQDNFDEISQWFPVQPADVADAVMADQIVFRFIYQEGFLGAFAGASGTLELENGSESMEAITKLRLSYLDAEERDVGHLVEYIASLTPAASAHHGLVCMYGESSGAFLAFELTAKVTQKVSGEELAAEAPIVPIVAGPPSPAFEDGESVCLVLLGATQGATGEAGAEGRVPGLHYTWSTNTEATDPGEGKAKRNAGNTILRLSETDKEGNAIAAFLATWDDSTTLTNRGTIIIRQVGSPKRFRILKITGVVEDAGTFDNIATALVVEGEALENGKEVVIEWLRTGDQGEKGEKGESVEGPAGPAGPHIERDQISNPVAGTGNLEWKHPVAGDNQGVLVLIAANATTADQVTSVTYDGVAMEEVAGSPFAHAAGAEDASLYAYFLGKGVSGGFGEVNVKVTVSGAASKQALCVTFKADHDLRIEGVKTLDSELTATPELSINFGSSRAFMYGLFHCGADEIGGVTAGTGTILFQHDFGSQTATWVELETFRGPAEATSTTMSVKQAADEAGAFGVAIGLVRDFGLVTELPSRPGKGDVCRYVADKTNGVVWDLIYDGEGEFPWKKIGGPPLFKEVETDQGTKSKAYAALATAGPAITLPLKGDYDVEIGCETFGGGAGTNAFMSYEIGATAPADADAVRQNNAGTTVLSGSRVKRKTGLAAVTLTAKYKVEAEIEKFFGRRWMRVDPVRVG